MKVRRELWRQNSGSAAEDEGVRRQSVADSQASIISPSATFPGAGLSESDVESGSTERSRRFKEDACYAAAFAASATSPPRRMSSNTSNGSDIGEIGAYFDLSQWDPQIGKRQTVFGPEPHRVFSRTKSLVAESDEEDFSLGPRDNRRAITGPSIRINDRSTSGHSEGYALGGAEEDVLGEDDSMISAPINDDELRRISGNRVNMR